VKMYTSGDVETTLRYVQTLPSWTLLSSPYHSVQDTFRYCSQFCTYYGLL